MRRAGALLATAALVSSAAAGILLATGSEPGQDAAEFQRVVGGLGLGPAVDLSRCAAEFDPRVGRACSFRHEPVPCGSFLCPVHASPRPPSVPD